MDHGSEKMKFKKCDYIIQQPKGSLLQLRL